MSAYRCFNGKLGDDFLGTMAAEGGLQVKDHICIVGTVPVTNKEVCRNLLVKSLQVTVATFNKKRSVSFRRTTSWT